jgi:N6-L-threonylcarbamoyladenine synthase
VIVLGIETSCDETSAAVVSRKGADVELRGLAILSQDIHRIFAGVVPELASRAHLEAILPVVEDALSQAGVKVTDLDGIAVTRGPGLLGALLVGVTWAKTLAWREGLPLIGVHHLEGHLFAATLEDNDLAPPFTALLVSGGHTMLLDVPEWGDYQLLGQTRDDAAGEAFDKVGTLLGIEYPAGAAIEQLASQGTPGRYVFPKPMLRSTGDDRWAFSFSGLKTAVLRAVQVSQDLATDRASIAHAFQAAVVEVLVTKTVAAARESGRKQIVIGGGVACNQVLAAAMRAAAPEITIAVASPRLNTDNAAMIAAAGAWRLGRGERDYMNLEASDSLPLPGLTSLPGVAA